MFLKYYSLKYQEREGKKVKKHQIKHCRLLDNGKNEHKKNVKEVWHFLTLRKIIEFATNLTLLRICEKNQAQIYINLS